MHSVEHIDLDAFSVVGLAARVRNDDMASIQAHWQRFMADQTFSRLAKADNGSVFSVYSEYESDYTGEYTLLLGYKVDPATQVPSGLRMIEVPAQSYAVILAQGEQPAAVKAAWEWVWASALDRTYGVDFDEYISPFDVRLHIAVRGAASL